MQNVGVIFTCKENLQCVAGNDFWTFFFSQKWQVFFQKWKKSKVTSDSGSVSFVQSEECSQLIYGTCTYHNYISVTVSKKALGVG